MNTRRIKQFILQTVMPLLIVGGCLFLIILNFIVLPPQSQADWFVYAFSSGVALMAAALLSLVVRSYGKE